VVGSSACRLSRGAYYINTWFGLYAFRTDTGKRAMLGGTKGGRDNIALAAFWLPPQHGSVLDMIWYPRGYRRVHVLLRIPCFGRNMVNGRYVTTACCGCPFSSFFLFFFFFCPALFHCDSGYHNTDCGAMAVWCNLDMDLPHGSVVPPTYFFPHTTSFTHTFLPTPQPLPCTHACLHYPLPDTTLTCI